MDRQGTMAAVAAMALSLTLVAADDAGQLRLGAYDEGRVVVSPGMPIGDSQPRDVVGPLNCTAGFVAGDTAYLEGRPEGRRYLLTIPYCLLIREYGEEHRWTEADGWHLHSGADSNPTLVVPAAGVDQRGPVIGHAIWSDQTTAPSDAGLGFLLRDAAVVLLDDDVSVDPEVPELGTPTEVARELRSVASHGASADVLDVFGRTEVLGEAAARRRGPVLGKAGSTHLCLGIPMWRGDYGAPLLDDEGRAAGLVALVDGVSSTSSGKEPCAAAAIAVQLADVLSRFQAATGIELHLLTERAGPIHRDAW